MTERRAAAPPPHPADLSPLLDDGLDSALNDRRAAPIAWLLSAGLRGPCLVAGAGPHPLPLELPWPDPVVQLETTDPGRIPHPDGHFAALILLPYGPAPAAAELERVLRPDADVVAVGEAPPLLRPWERWCVVKDGMGRPRLLCLDDDDALRAAAADLPRRWRLAPPPLVRLLRRPGLHVFRGAGRPSRLATVLERTCERGGAALIQDKGKLTLRLRADGEDAFLKLAKTRQAAHDLANAAATLDRLHAHLAPDHVLRPVLPRILAHHDLDGAHAWLESACAGTPLADLEDAASLPALMERTADLLAAIAALPPDLVPPGPPAAAAAKDEFLRDLAAALGDREAAVYDRVAAVLVACESTPRLRKGDFSLSNVLARDGRITGLIDWDESGVTRRPLSNLADLLFSWLWQREGLPRSRSLQAMVSGELPPLSLGLDPWRLVERVGGDRRTLAFGALESWTDHVYHELKHPRTLRKPGRVRSLFGGPLEKLGDALANLERGP